MCKPSFDRYVWEVVQILVTSVVSDEWNWPPIGFHANSNVVWKTANHQIKWKQQTWLTVKNVKPIYVFF